MKKGFTLIEILIATAIFASVALMANIVVAQSINYLTKTRVVRSTTADASKVAEAISADFRSANETFKIGSTEFKNGFATLDCISTLKVITGTMDGSFDGTKTNTIFLLNKTADNKYKYTIYKKESGGTLKSASKVVADLTDVDTISEVCGVTLGNILTSENTISATSWSGYNRDATSNSVKQSHLDFIITVKSPNYDLSTTREQEKSITSIKSSVTARSLNVQ